MTTINTIFLYVADATASALFYADLLAIQPVEASPGFALFILPSGVALGLGTKSSVQPVPPAAAGGSELGLRVKTPAEIDSTHATWAAKGITIPFPPTDLDFGRSFVAHDPDGNRLRVYAVFDEA